MLQCIFCCAEWPQTAAIQYFFFFFSLLPTAADCLSKNKQKNKQKTRRTKNNYKNGGTRREVLATQLLIFHKGSQ